MAIRNIATDGDEILRKHCKPVKVINGRVRTLCLDMIDTMISADGVGLAAPQVGVMKRIFVCRPDVDQMDQCFVMINPEITHTEGSQESTEGCLSVPGYVGTLERPERVRLHAQDLDGNEQEYEFSGFAATVICHEYDHLEGLLYTDKARDIMTSEQYDEMLKARQEENASEGEE